MTIATFVLAGFLGYLYVALVSLEPYALAVPLKVAPMLLLTVLAAGETHGWGRWALCIALLASAVGDLLLGMDRSANLKPALLAFLVTQVLYAGFFWRHFRVTSMGLVGAALVVGYATALVVLLWPNLGNVLRLAITLYSMALAVMASGAILSTMGGWLPLGGVLFLIADSLIAINQFLHPFAGSTQIIVTLYISAQLIIAWYLIHALRGQARA